MATGSFQLRLKASPVQDTARVQQTRAYEWGGVEGIGRGTEELHPCPQGAPSLREIPV